MVKAAEELNYPLIDLPISYQERLSEANIEDCLVDESDFLDDVFKNIIELSEKNRNEVLFLCFKVYAHRSEDYIEEHLKSSKCIPCSPDGSCIKECSEIVDPCASFSYLYDQSDQVFPLDRFHKDKLVHSSMKDLGMIHNYLPLAMIVERARTILSLSSRDKKKALKKSMILLQCITQLMSQRDGRNVLLSKAEELMLSLIHI